MTGADGRDRPKWPRFGDLVDVHAWPHGPVTARGASVLAVYQTAGDWYASVSGGRPVPISRLSPAAPPAQMDLFRR